MYSPFMGIITADRTGWLESSGNLCNIPFTDGSRLSIGSTAIYELESNLIKALGFTTVVSVNMRDAPRHKYGITEKCVQVSLEDGNLLQTFTEVCKFIAAHMRPKRGVLLYGDNFTLNLTLAVAYRASIHLRGFAYPASHTL
ncbi:hypothetical protein FA95DRAFT_1306576 [Auriscalpium vulgare]|uniref:Uncharacterized protein n=1 Tax=Auriscalpium vulgare TaxID=40419 RepID=A0ACB8R2Q4_9AGAM|nr:hypothetical protein FA95DRAFT_1306576 [Auriscalpium vulgare]